MKKLIAIISVLCLLVCSFGFSVCAEATASDTANAPTEAEGVTAAPLDEENMSVLLSSTVSEATPVDTVTLVGGETECVIVVSASPSLTEQFAAETLQKYILQITGKNLSITSETPAIDINAIAVGNTSLGRVDVSEYEDGGYIIKLEGNRLYICGAGNRGTIYGVYGFLRKFCNCRWYTKDVISVPESAVISLPDTLEEKYTTAFEYADTDWLSPRDIEYSLANGLSGGVYRDIPENMGGAVEYIGQFCHSLATVYCSRDTYFEEHPEYFALRDGKRVSKQLCLTNDDVYEIVLSEVLAAIKENHDPDAALQILSLTQDDNEEYCCCDKCKALDDANGAHSGTMITFVNRIAKDVKLAGYDNVAIDTFAYRYTRQAPSKVVPEENVIVRLCTIECCFAHTLDDPDCADNTALMKDLRDWAALTDRIYVWDYSTNYAQTIGIFPDFGVLQGNMQVFFENGVKGVYEEGNYYIDACDNEFGELRAYLLSALMQDPYCDYYAEMDGFLNAYYGDGGYLLREFIDTVTENAVADGQSLSIYNSMTKTLSLTDEQIAACDKLWADAKTACGDDETRLSRVSRSEICWRYWKAVNNKGEFASAFARPSNKKQLFNDIVASGTTMHREGKDLVEYSFIYMLDTPENWFNPEQGSTQKASIYALPVIFAALIASFVAAVFIFIRAIKQKRYGYTAILPFLAAFVEVGLWNRRAYIAWKDIGQFALTCVLFAAFFGAVTFAAENAKRKKDEAKLSKKKTALCFVFGAAAWAVPYFTISTLVNVVAFHGAANRATSIFMIAAMCVEMAIMLPVAAKRLGRK